MKRVRVTNGTGMLFACFFTLLLAAPGCGGSQSSQDPCEGIDCSGHGQCWNRSGLPWCECDPGYFKEGLDCIKEPEPCDDVDCGGHGSCEDGSGVAVCTCDPGYQDNDGDNVCTADCTTAGLDCDPEAPCTDASGTAVCGCPPGYEWTGDACVWGENPRDSGFRRTDVWTASGGAEVNPQAGGNLDPGAGVFGVDAVCGGGTLSQTIEMPSFAESETMQLQVYLFAEQCQGCSAFEVHGVRLNGFPLEGFLWNFFPIGEWTRNTACLGDGLYGGPLTLELFRNPGDTRCGTPEDMLTINTTLVDNVTITPDTEGVCPRPGEVLNGDFEAGWEGWENVSPFAEDIIEIQDGAGVDGSHAAVFVAEELWDYISLKGRLSVPSAMSSPALELHAGGTPGAVLKVMLEGKPAGEIVGNVPDASGRFCLPAWTRGVAFDVTFILTDCDMNLASCEGLADREFRLDGLHVVDEPLCGEAPLIDGGFELAAQGLTLARSWTLSRGQGGGVGGQAQIRVDQGMARTEQSALYLEAAGICASAIAETSFRSSGAAPGLAVSFWYKSPGFVNAELSAGVPGNFVEFAANNEWTRGVVCVPPGRDGLITPFYLRMSGGMGSCSVTYEPEYVWIDDVELVSDPSCL